MIYNFFYYNICLNLKYLHLSIILFIVLDNFVKSKKFYSHFIHTFMIIEHNINNLFELSIPSKNFCAFHDNLCQNIVYGCK